MARVLIVGCGCAGTELGHRLTHEGWAVRGTSRSGEGAARIESAALEGVVADPDRVGTVLEHVSDVAVVVWALAEASGPSAAAVNGPRLERVLERLVDTPVRGFVLDAPPGNPEATDLATAAHETWRLPVRVVAAERSAPAWAQRMHAAVGELLGSDG